MAPGASRCDWRGLMAVCYHLQFSRDLPLLKGRVHLAVGQLAPELRVETFAAAIFPPTYSRGRCFPYRSIQGRSSFGAGVRARRDRFPGTIGRVDHFSFYRGRNHGAFEPRVLDDSRLADRIRLKHDHGDRGRTNYIGGGINNLLNRGSVGGTPLPRALERTAPTGDRVIPRSASGPLGKLHV